jgi:hypothetical protein
MGGAGTLIKEVEAMEKKLQQLQKTIEEVLTLAYDKAVRTQKRDVEVYVPLPYLPPSPPYKSRVVDSQFGQVRIFTMASKKGGWVIRVKFPQEAITFNPPLKRREAEEILKRFSQTTKGG